MKYTLAFVLALAPMLAACGSSADPAAVKETIAATQEAQMQAIASRDIEGATRVFHADATVTLPDGSQQTGAAAVRAEYEKMMADPAMAVTLTPGTAWASEGGDLAVTTGTGNYTTTGPDGLPVTLPFRNQTVWTKADSGPWLIVSDVNYASAPKATDAAPASTSPSAAAE